MGEAAERESLLAVVLRVAGFGNERENTAPQQTKRRTSRVEKSAKCKYLAAQSRQNSKRKSEGEAGRECTWEEKGCRKVMLMEGGRGVEAEFGGGQSSFANKERAAANLTLHA